MPLFLQSHIYKALTFFQVDRFAKLATVRRVILQALLTTRNFSCPLLKDIAYEGIGHRKQH